MRPFSVVREVIGESGEKLEDLYQLFGVSILPHFT